jgi:hypothetical protein
MKNRAKLLRIIILIAMMFALTIPSGAVLADDDDNDKPHEIFFWVENESQFEFTLWLYGPQQYTVTVEPHSEARFILKNGWYAFTMYSCNLYKTGTLDFTSHKTMHVPVCGATAGPIGKAGAHYDSSDYIRPASIQIRNKTLEYIDVYIRTLEEHHFMSFEPLEIQWLLVEDASQTFVYSFIACDELQSGYTRLYTHVPFDLECKKK